MTTMIEKLARAIWDSFQTDPNRPGNDRQFFLDNRMSILRGHGHGFAEGHWSAAARAAIEAMREPTEAMVEAGDQVCIDIWPLGPPTANSEDGWRAMIDTALSEDKGR